MKYSVYRVEQDASYAPLDIMQNLNLYVSENAYIFYKSSYAQPEAIYPIHHFYILKEA